MRVQGRRGLILALPLILWLAAFLLVPLGLVASYSFLKRGPYGGVIMEFSLDSYRRALDPLYLAVYARSLVLAGMATLTCLAIGYPSAFVIATAPRPWRRPLVSLLMIPFLANFIVRTYAIRAMLAVDGPLNHGLMALGLVTEPLILTDGPLAVWIGMVTNYLPFMILPLFVVMDRLDFRLIEAARDLGASQLGMLWSVLLPLTKPGIVAGSVLVFIPALGEFMIPDILGGGRTLLLGNLITDQFLKSRNWPFGATLTVILMVAMLLAALVEWRLQERPSHE